MMTQASIAARMLANGLESSLQTETGGRSDVPEGTVTVEVSATLMREIIRMLRGEA